MILPNSTVIYKDNKHMLIHKPPTNVYVIIKKNVMHILVTLFDPVSQFGSKELLRVLYESKFEDDN